MKPCRSYRKQLALHAAAALTDAERGAVSQHIRQCRACRKYLAAVSSVCADHEQAANSLTPLKVNERVYRRLFRQIRNSGPPETIRVRARVALSFAAVVLVGLIWILGSGPLVKQKGTIHKTAAGFKEEPAQPTSNHMAYRLALNQSFEELDQLLAQPVADRNSPGQSLFRSRAALLGPGL